jgi:hypothetical protein
VAGNPDRTRLVLVTPGLFWPPAANGLDGARLNGWLMPAYRDPKGSLLAAHLPHLEPGDLDGVGRRLGWATWEDFNAVRPDACRWLAGSAANESN